MVSSDKNEIYHPPAQRSGAELTARPMSLRNMSSLSDDDTVLTPRTSIAADTAT